MKLQVVRGDITTVETDAIVNAANSSSLLGSPAILEACKAIRARQGGCETGQAVITTAGELPARYVIHTVGPVWRGGGENEPQLLASCYTSRSSTVRRHWHPQRGLPQYQHQHLRLPEATGSRDRGCCGQGFRPSGNTRRCAVRLLRR